MVTVEEAQTNLWTSRCGHRSTSGSGHKSNGRGRWYRASINVVWTCNICVVPKSRRHRLQWQWGVSILLAPLNPAPWPTANALKLPLDPLANTSLLVWLHRLALSCYSYTHPVANVADDTNNTRCARTHSVMIQRVLYQSNQSCSHLANKTYIPNGSRQRCSLIILFIAPPDW